MRAIDTNVLERALVNDNAAQSARAVALLTAHDIYIPVTVVLELEWVLRSRYAFAPKVVAQVLRRLRRWRMWWWVSARLCWPPQPGRRRAGTLLMRCITH